MKNKQYLELKALIENTTNTSMYNCSIGETKFDGKAIAAVNTIAEALETQANANRMNSDAIQDLISIFKSQKIEISIGAKK